MIIEKCRTLFSDFMFLMGFCSVQYGNVDKILPILSQG